MRWFTALIDSRLQIISDLHNVIIDMFFNLQRNRRRNRSPKRNPSTSRCATTDECSRLASVAPSIRCCTVGIG
eukprot:scaffold298811_cov28-Prasinocladus_malaysianus.AAC.1